VVEERNCEFAEVYGRGEGAGVQREAERSCRRLTIRKRGMAQRIVSMMR
jgi:hypothetical protein